MWSRCPFGASPLTWGKKGGNSFPRKKNGTFMAGMGSGILKKWRESTFRSESETKPEKSTQKKDRKPEFRGIPNQVSREGRKQEVSVNYYLFSGI
jgi:hypothetical protein